MTNITFHVTSLFLTFCSAASAAQCELSFVNEFNHEEIGNISIYKHTKTGAVVFRSIMHVNADGAPDAYHPDDNGTVHLCNGMRVGSTCANPEPWVPQCMPAYRQARRDGFKGKTSICFFSMVTKDGIPQVQGADDPNPGYFISTTGLHQPGGDLARPSGYVNSNVIPFAVVPSSWQSTGLPGPKLGDFGIAYRISNDKAAAFVVADTGPKKKLGEGSVALLQALGHDSFIQRFGKRRAFSGIFRRDVLYVMFPKSAEADSPISTGMIEARRQKLIDSMGGIQGLRDCSSRL